MLSVIRSICPSGWRRRPLPFWIPGDSAISCMLIWKCDGCSMTKRVWIRRTNRGNEKLEKIHVNHVDIFYEKVGQGRPVVLIHGNGEDHTIFDRTVHLLEEKYTCYLPDSRGHGKSQWTREFHYRDMAEDLIQFLEKLNLRDTAVVGFSDGGIIGLLAAPRTNRITSLVACGANTRPEGLRGLCLTGMKIHH